MIRWLNFKEAALGGDWETSYILSPVSYALKFFPEIHMFQSK